MKGKHPKTQEVTYENNLQKLQAEMDRKHTALLEGEHTKETNEVVEENNLQKEQAAMDKKHLALLAGVHTEWKDDDIYQAQKKSEILDISANINNEGVEAAVAKIPDDELRETLSTVIKEQIAATLKAELALFKISQCIDMYDNRNVRNKRARMRKNMREARAILEII